MVEVANDSITAFSATQAIIDFYNKRQQWKKDHSQPYVIYGEPIKDKQALPRAAEILRLIGLSDIDGVMGRDNILTKSVAKDSELIVTEASDGGASTFEKFVDGSTRNITRFGTAGPEGIAARVETLDALTGTSTGAIIFTSGRMICIAQKSGEPVGYSVSPLKVVPDSAKT
jgi:hypothetical protein